jgi:cytochrome P450
MLTDTSLANAEMRLALARVLFNFDLELQPESHSWNEQDIFVFWQKGALNVKVTPREL